MQDGFPPATVTVEEAGRCDIAWNGFQSAEISPAPDIGQPLFLPRYQSQAIDRGILPVNKQALNILPTVYVPKEMPLSSEGCNAPVLRGKPAAAILARGV